MHQFTQEASEKRNWEGVNQDLLNAFSEKRRSNTSIFNFYYFSKINFIVFTKQFKDWNLPRANCKKETGEEV